ncbi:MAG: hypothetical protein R3F51_18975 [Cyanobacteriota/Melainabacteria group bacterium]
MDGAETNTLTKSNPSRQATLLEITPRDIASYRLALSRAVVAVMHQRRNMPPTLTVADGMTESPRDSLTQSMDKAGYSPSDRAQMSQNFDKFEKNARENGLNDTQIGDTYKQLNRILTADSAMTSPELRSKFVQQWSEKLADPGKIRQGWHDTCGMAFYQKFAIQTMPDRLTGVMADALTKGNMMVPDDSRSLLGMVFYDRGQAKGERSLPFEKGNYQPDSEAQGKGAHKDGRDYADQVAQVTLNSIKWNVKETDPDGTVTTQGRLTFKQCEKVERPSDSQPPDPHADKSCESVEQKSFWGGKIVHDANGYGFGGASTMGDLARIHRAITGKNAPLMGFDSNKYSAAPKRWGTSWKDGRRMVLCRYHYGYTRAIPASESFIWNVTPRRPTFRDDYDAHCRHR